MSALIWIKTVGKGYQQTTLVGRVKQLTQTLYITSHRKTIKLANKKGVNELTLCVPIDSSFWFYTVHLGWSTVYLEGSQVIISKKYCIFSLKMDFV